MHLTTVSLSLRKYKEPEGADAMKESIVGKNEAGQRFDKLLGKILNEAPAGFIYKMLRKKNIKLNQRKADGREILKEGDLIQIYLSDETFLKFHKDKKADLAEDAEAFRGQALSRSRILYQDTDIMIINKQAGLLSQKARPEDDSLNEQMLRYLLATQAMKKEQLVTFTPSVCNRLDRNTSGIVLAGISLAGSQMLSAMLKERTLHKYYLALVQGSIREAGGGRAYLLKDTRKNCVRICHEPKDGAVMIETQYRPLYYNSEYTLLEVELITGKSHQIRAYLASLGHPILGDAKYGNRTENQSFRSRYGMQNQCLHAYRVEFPVLEGDWSHLSQKTWTAPLPEKYQSALEAIWGKELRYGNME